MMKSVFISFLGILLLASCKSGFAPKIPGETTYKEFSKAQKSYKTKDGKIAYVDKGSGPVLLLLHG
ncbi:MAG: alpha/beta hydrolase, partial [Flavobacteriaceae bacterium]|nr:alpha/beta hydrolase [Flavobacteriaceae bacterium]